MTRFAPPLLALLLCGTALAGCASDNAAPAAADVSTHKKVATATDFKNLPTDVEGGVRQAQLERVAGNYDEAIRTLSQLMLVASDDPRVVGEYGKTLAEKGRAQEAIQFLNRAIELQSTDWTLYSALGVAYDQVGDQTAARTAYEHALKMKPGEPSVLNNYALSRMLANDPVGAQQLIARAEIAGGASDPKIARNIAMMNQLTPAAEVVTGPVQKAAPAQMAASAPLGTPTPIGSHALPPLPQLAQYAPGQPAQHPAPAAQPSPAASPAPAPQVVMQRVPFDPLAGPVKATHAPTPLVRHEVAMKKAEPAPKLAVQAPDAKGVAVSKPDTAKADPKAATKALPAKPDPKSVKAAEVKPDAKIGAKADAKNSVKPAANNAIPALRQTASAY